MSSPRGREHVARAQEIKDYKDFRDRYSLVAMVVGILVLLLLYPVVQWLMRTGVPMLAGSPLPAVVLEWAAPATVLLVFLLVILPSVSGRLRVWRRYRWTREEMRALDRELKSLPNGDPAAALPGSAKGVPARKLHGPPVALLVLVFALCGLVFANKYTDFKPLDVVAPLVGIKSATVNGEYIRHYEAVNLGGVTLSKQTWSYVFRSDGSYTTYLDGHQQYSGRWSQSGNVLTVTVPAIPTISPAYSFKATVSRDRNSFTAGKDTYVRRKK
jgi:hypothetical protein